MRLWVFLLAMVFALPVAAEEVTCGPQGAWHDPAMDYHLDDLLALIEARLDWEEGKPRDDDPGDPERVAAAVAAWQRLAVPHEGRPGNAEARWWLGHLMMEGQAGFEADAWGALEFLLPAAEAGHLEAMTQAGRILVREENAERLAPKVFAHDPDVPAPTKGRACLKRAAWLGNREAQAKYGRGTQNTQAESAANYASSLDLEPSGLSFFSTRGSAMRVPNSLRRNALEWCAKCGHLQCQTALVEYYGAEFDPNYNPERATYWLAVAGYHGGSEKAADIVGRLSADLIQEGNGYILESARSFKARRCTEYE
ncbi:hypothetical protein [Roseospirillum parvum]|uniref:Sel1 repeat family protein n=1 Tax=Roseospirillum parvum TaxID=83401 RepID=A0A1G7UW70_9PROT|nr:hypothetical protein [Roseospirillum parvum]SDG51747.1 hypothetical protein SAMN05421742_101452 [Roseospirillum parvum]